MKPAENPMLDTERVIIFNRKLAPERIRLFLSRKTNQWRSNQWRKLEDFISAVSVEMRAQKWKNAENVLWAHLDGID